MRFPKKHAEYKAEIPSEDSEVAFFETIFRDKDVVHSSHSVPRE